MACRLTAIAHYSSRPTVSQLKGDLRITDPKRHKFPPSLTFLSLQNSRLMASRLTAVASFPSVLFQLLQYLRQHPSSLVHWVSLMTKTDLIYPAFSFRFVVFAVQFCFRCELSFHKKRRSSQVVWFSWTNHNLFLRIATTNNWEEATKRRRNRSERSKH